MSILKNGKLLGAAVNDNDTINFGDNSTTAFWYDGTDFNIDIGPNATALGWPHAYDGYTDDYRPTSFINLHNSGLRWNAIIDASNSSPDSPLPEGNQGIFTYINNYNDLFFQLNDNDMFIIDNHTPSAGADNTFIHCAHDGTLRLKGYDSWLQRIVSDSPPNNALVGGDKWGVIRGQLALDIQSTHYYDAVAIGDYSVCLGLNVRADGTEAISIGNASYAANDNSICFGAHNFVYGDDSIAVGSNNNISGGNSPSDGENSLIFGNNNNIEGINSIAIGRGHTVIGDNSVVVGSLMNMETNNAHEYGYWDYTADYSPSGSPLSPANPPYSPYIPQRIASIRIHPNGQLAASFRVDTVAPTDGGAIDGAEADGTLPRGMYTIQKVYDDVTMFYNEGGDVQYAIIGSTDPTRLISYLPPTTPYLFTPTVANTYEKILMPTTQKTVKNFAIINTGGSPADLRYQYQGFVTKNFTVDAVMTIATASATGTTIEVVMSNGSYLDSPYTADDFESGVYSRVYLKASGEPLTIPITGWFTMNPLDVIAIWVRSTNTSQLTFAFASIKIVEVI